MFTSIVPKLPMRSQKSTIDYYVNKLNFELISDEYEEYLIIEKDDLELHFFLYRDLDIAENFGQIYIRTEVIDDIYQGFLATNVAIHPNGSLTDKPWGVREFSLLDPDNNLLTFGQIIR